MKIAVVGTGVSGLVAAHHLARNHELTVFEASPRIGGHVHTHDVEVQGRTYAVDSGFIVYNERNYPHFTRLLAELGVETQPTEMSFAVKCERTGLEYNGTSFATLFAQRRNLFRPSFHRMLRDVMRFHRQAPKLLAAQDHELSMRSFLAQNRYSREFQEHYLVPMGAAIWSTGPEKMLDFPALFFVRFFSNHGMLQVNGRPTWRVVKGGSKQYVEKLIAPFRERIRTSCPVEGVRRLPGGVQISTPEGEEQFDEVVIATHSDQALRLLDDPTPDERRILAALPYQPNEAVLHTDVSLLPDRRRAWAAWNYIIPRQGQARVAVTYNMNILQGLDAPETLCVTLNRTAAIAASRVIRVMTYHHPVYDMGGVQARNEWEHISGWNRTHYCGAYWGNGFHEDGVNSALAVVRSLTAVPQS